MTATAAAARMLTHPDDFFKYYPVMMDGGTGVFVPNASNQKTYYLSKKSPDTVGTVGNVVGHYGATRPGIFSARQISSFRMSMQAATNCSGQLQTHGVPMVNYDSNLDGKVNLHATVTAMDHYVVGAGAHYMTTGLLTGCCFAWIEAGGALWCVHVRPKDGITGVQLHTLIATQGRFAARPHTPLSTFGRNDYTNYAIVIGVNTVTGWKLYAQTSSDQFRTITGAWQIAPGAARRL